MPFILEEEEEVPETTPQKVGRHVARTGARALETALGMPGELLALLHKPVDILTEKLGIPSEKELLPTSEDITKGVTERFTGEYLKPKTKTEAVWDEIISDAVGLMIPSPGKVKTLGKLGLNFLKKLGISGGANLVGESVEAAGGGEVSKQGAKLGSMLMLGALRKGTAKSHVAQLYKDAEEAIKGNPTVDATRLSRNIDSLTTSLKKGLEAPSEKAVLNSLSNLKKKIRGGEIPVDEIWASKRSINEEMSKALFESPSKASKARARNLFKKINKDLNHELSKYGAENPEFGKAFKAADEGYATLSQSEIVGNFIKKHGKIVHASPLLYPLLHEVPGPTALGAVGGTLLYKGGQLGYRLMKSPTLRNHYGNVVKQAALENVGGMNRALTKMNNDIQKEKERTREKRFVLQESS